MSGARCGAPISIGLMHLKQINHISTEKAIGGQVAPQTNGHITQHTQTQILADKWRPALFLPLTQLGPSAELCSTLAET